MKTSLIVVVTLFAVSLCRAEMPSVENCAAIEDPDERLACYDAMAGRLPVDTEEAGDVALPPAEPSPSVAEPALPMVEPAPPVAESAAPAAEPAADVVAEPEPDPVPGVSAVEPALEAEADFGFEHKRKPDPDRIRELKTRWTRKKKDPYGKWIITMENGQVWRQVDSAHLSLRDPERRVVVFPGTFGSFFLGEPESGSRIRVKRVR